MRIKGLIDEDFVNYRKPSMYIACPSCSWKCERECGMRVCQNSALANSPDIYISTQALVERYVNNPITSAIVFGGLEPIDSFMDLARFLYVLRTDFNCDDDVVIYTGYREDELAREIDILKQYKNIVIKFGRFVPNQSASYDEVLGVYLASDNQYARRIS